MITVEPKKDSPRLLIAWLAAFFLAGFGAKLWTIQLWATNLPYWDQWDEARLLFKPWLEGTLTWHDFFIPHNEHRIAFTRLLDLLEVKLNGQWDPAFQMVVNAVIHLGYGVLLATVIWSLAGRRHVGLICFALLPFFALPFAGENTTHGFQSQMYLVSLFSVAAILGLGFARPGRGLWFCGLLLAVMAIFTMASGFLAGAAVIGLEALRRLKQRRLTPAQILTLASAGAVVALGLALKVVVAQHQVLQAQSMADFFRVLLENLAWPFNNLPVMAPVTGLPLILLAAKYFQPHFKNPRAAEFILAFALWGLLQAATLAFGRAELAASSRYLDALGTLPIASLGAVFLLAVEADFPRRLKITGLVFAVSWSALLLYGLGVSSYSIAGDYLHGSRAWGLLETENVRAFVATGDAGWLKSPMKLAVPYWNQDWLTDLLRQPKILSIMPADARPALRLEPDAAQTAGFFTNGAPAENPGRPFATVWGNCLTNGQMTAGHFVSRPMSASLPKLAVQLYPGTGDVAIKLTGADHHSVELRPDVSGRWTTLVVDAPPGPFVLSVDNAAAAAPTAIGEIKELGRFSVFAQTLIAHAVLILCLGLALCLVLALAAMTRPGISLANAGLPWLLVLLTAIAALAGTVGWRHVDANGFTVALQKQWAVDFTRIGHPGRAELHLREALWLRPDDVEAGKELATLKAHGFTEPLPEKNP